MYRVLKPFELIAPSTLEEAAKVLRERGAGAEILAGGVDLVLRMRLRKIEPACVVSLHKITGQDMVKGDGQSGLTIGCMTTLRSVETSPAARDFSALVEGIQSISTVQVKNMGTVVGNLCVATPATDVAPPLFVLGASLKVAGPDGEKFVPIEDFYLGVNKTVLEPGQVVTEIVIPGLPTGAGSAFLKAGKTGATIAKVNAAVMVVMAGEVCEDVRIALGSVAPTVIRAVQAEELLKGQRIDDDQIARAAETASGEASPITDIRSTDDYRRHMIKIMVRDALKKASARAQA